MQLYKRLSRVGFLQKSYAFKFLFIAFLGIHIPLIGILFFVLYAPPSISSHMILLFALLIPLLWGRFVKLHSRLQIALIETLDDDSKSH